MGPRAADRYHPLNQKQLYKRFVEKFDEDDPHVTGSIQHLNCEEEKAGGGHTYNYLTADDRKNYDDIRTQCTK